jgi:hypothetical protein
MRACNDRLLQQLVSLALIEPNRVLQHLEAPMLPQHVASGLSSQQQAAIKQQGANGHASSDVAWFASASKHLDEVGQGCLLPVFFVWAYFVPWPSEKACPVTFYACMIFSTPSRSWLSSGQCQSASVRPDHCALPFLSR